jgi:hypothetical protein
MYGTLIQQNLAFEETRDMSHIRYQVHFKYWLFAYASWDVLYYLSPKSLDSFLKKGEPVKADSHQIQEKI